MPGCRLLGRGSTPEKWTHRGSGPKIDGNSDSKNYADHLCKEAGAAILAWIMEGARLIYAEDYHLSERTRDLYQAYRTWAMSTSGWARPMVDFNATVEHHGFIRKKTMHGMSVHGLALKNEFDN